MVLNREKQIALFNLICCQPDINKIYLYAKDPYEAKHQLLINKCEGLSLKEHNTFKGFIEYSNNIGDTYDNN